jgi:flagellar biosynthetic protein FliR
MTSTVVAAWATAILLVSLRIAPVFLFAPPFTLIRLPRRFRLLLAIALSACLVSGQPEFAPPGLDAPGALIVAAARELALGLTFVLAFQILFGALYMAGRTIDIQAGFGLAMLIDPTSRAQTPLVGTLFAYAAGAVFFAADGHLALLRLFSESLHAIPVGAWSLPKSLGPLLAYISAMFIAAMGVGGAAILTLLLIDIAIAVLSRTVPQMNVLVLGFQVKTVALLLVLPAAFGMGGAMIAHMLALTLSSLPKLI